MKFREDRHDVVVTTSAGNQTIEPPHSEPTGGDGNSRSRQALSCNSPAGGNSQMPGPEHVRACRQ